ncbi:hypothetical protein ACFOD4_05410 [Pseudoroseomonas globiformis]|uniref:Uncharacterized protein n=2 Tax=Teichococcus globiformis TaxID=2307229 RepID=A0ABV7FYW8_9PROT
MPAMPELDPRAPRAEAHAARCGAGTEGLTGGPGRDLTLDVGDLLPFAREILARRDIRVLPGRGGSPWRLELHLENLRDLPAPEGHPATIYLPGEDASRVLQDRRSAIRQLWRVDEATVKAADIAYDVRHDALGTPPRLDRPGFEAEMPDYRLLRIHADLHSGFAAVVLEARPDADLPPHRIYAIAGTHVFEHRDFRSWASGLTLGRAQFTSNAALAMIREAADYASDPASGGEVFITGQSQGGLVAQGIGFLLQSFLDTRPGAPRLAHVVSWGAVGAGEVLRATMSTAREGGGRGYGARFERHWAATDQTYPAAADVWNAITRRWAAFPEGNEERAVGDIMGRMRVLGYFFEIDLFARAGSFPGTTLAFPTSLILPDNCDLTVVEALFGIGAGRFGVRLESHFLKGYRRAVERGAIAVARPALPAKWDWVMEAQQVLDPLGYAWLQTLYFDGPGSARANWEQCRAAPEWTTPANLSCRQGWWPGCAPLPEERRWCLVREAPPGMVSPIGSAP